MAFRQFFFDTPELANFGKVSHCRRLARISRPDGKFWEARVRGYESLTKVKKFSTFQS